jgi:hypothetical protein
VCSFSNIASHQNRLLLFVKHLAMSILTRKYRIRQYTDWQQNFGIQEVFVCDKCSSSDETVEITAVPISSSASAARIQYCHWFRRFVREQVPMFCFKWNTVYFVFSEGTGNLFKL